MQVEEEAASALFRQSQEKQLISSTEMDDHNYRRKRESSLNFTHDFWKGIEIKHGKYWCKNDN